MKTKAEIVEQLNYVISKQEEMEILRMQTTLTLVRALEYVQSSTDREAEMAEQSAEHDKKESEE